MTDSGFAVLTGQTGQNGDGGLMKSTRDQDAIPEVGRINDLRSAPAPSTAKAWFTSAKS